MTVDKLAISLPHSLVAGARRAVREGRASSVSAYVAAAVEAKAKLDDLAHQLARMLEESGGPLTDRERRHVDRALGLENAGNPTRGKRRSSRRKRR